MDTKLIEEIVRRVVQEVLQELPASEAATHTGLKNKSERMDFSGYKTPVVTERQIQRLHELTGEIVIPGNTIITPKARDIIREKGIKITMEKWKNG
jgi:hypothetical protein